MRRPSAAKNLALKQNKVLGTVKQILMQDYAQSIRQLNKAMRSLNPNRIGNRGHCHLFIPI